MKKVSKDKTSKKRSRAIALEEDEDGAWTRIDSFSRPEMQIQAFEKGQEITYEVVHKKLFEILTSRGKKGTSVNEQYVLLIQVEEKISKSVFVYILSLMFLS